MFTTSLTAAVLTGVFASGSLESPKWQSSYREASAAAANLRKPIVVFIVSGSPGKLVKEGVLDKDANRLLRDGFIPLTINTSTTDGQELARTFGMTEGLVISDSTGGVQALRHAGGLTSAELAGYLEQFAATATVATTEYRGAAVAPVAQPLYQYQPQYASPQAQNRPVLNALHNVGSTAVQFGANTIQYGANAIQNFGGFISGSS